MRANINLAKETNGSLLGLYQHFHDESAFAIEIVKELKARGYDPKVVPFDYADGTRSYEPVVFKGTERVL